MAETNIVERPVTRIARARRALLASIIGDNVQSILEIGALDNPTFLSSERETRYLDYFSASELKEKASRNSNRSPDKLVNVTYVLGGRVMSDVVDRTFDLVIANHVIEHVPDMIGWLIEVGQLTDPGGHLFLSVPDRRFTFDYFRPVTDAVELVRAHDEKRTRPSEYQIARQLYYQTELRVEDAWSGKRPTRLVPRLNLAKAMERGRARASVYTDVHCWVFTEDSFLQIIDDLSSAALVPWKLRHLQPVCSGENEFRVILERL